MRVMTVRAKRLIPLVVVGVVAAGCAGGSKAAEPSTSFDVADSTTSTPFIEDPSDELPLLGSEDFDDSESGLFWTGQDELLSSTVSGGELHMGVVLGSSVQALRSTWPPLTAVTLESDITIVAHAPGTFTASCWSGADEYSLGMTGDQRLAVITRAHEGGTISDTVVLADLGYTSLARPAGVPFRVRVSCYGEDGADWFAGWIDDAPVALVELPEVVGRFDAVGYTASVVSAGDGLVIDNVKISEGYPSGGPRPSANAPADSVSESTVFEHDGVSFEFPSSWVYFDLPSSNGDAWTFGAGPVGAANVIALISLGSQLMSDLGMTPSQAVAEYIEAWESEGLTMRSDPEPIRLGDRDGTLLTYDNLPSDSQMGQSMSGDLVLVFGDTGSYVIAFRYPLDREAELRPIWERSLATMEIPD